MTGRNAYPNPAMITRALYGVSRLHVAAALGVEDAVLRRWESGEPVPFAMLQRLAEVSVFPFGAFFISESNAADFAFEKAADRLAELTGWEDGLRSLASRNPYDARTRAGRAWKKGLRRAIADTQGGAS